MFKQTLIALVLCLAAVTVSGADGGPGHGWGDDIDWKTFTEGKAASAETGKPLMLIIHKSWCGACKALKPKFGASAEIAALAKSFVMVNVEDDEEPTDSQFSPDGGYIPRILYMSADGKVQPDVYNKEGSDKYKYYYSDAGSVKTGMENAVSHFKNDA